MADYQQVSSGIGNLLRMIKEQRSQGPIVPPSADVASPIRETVQGPVKTPESPETNRVISVRPEQSPGGNVGPVVGPLNPAVPAGSTPIGPVAPVAPSVNRPVPTPVPTPSQPISKGGIVPSDVKPVAQPSLATRITAPIAGSLSVLPGTSLQRVGPAVLNPPNPTPTPAPSQAGSKSEKQTGFGAQISSAVPYPTPGAAPNKPASSYLPFIDQNSGPSLATKILSTIQKSPFDWLFGKR